MSRIGLRRLPVVVLCLAGCTTMKPVEMPPAELHEKILAENVLPAGESVRVVTADGQIRKFRVVEVDTDERVIRGKDVSVDVDQVVAVETTEFSLGKTAALAGGSYLILGLIAIAIAPALLL